MSCPLLQLPLPVLHVQLSVYRRLALCRWFSILRRQSHCASSFPRMLTCQNCVVHCIVYYIVIALRLLHSYSFPNLYRPKLGYNYLLSLSISEFYFLLTHHFLSLRIWSTACCCYHCNNPVIQILTYGRFLITRSIQVGIRRREGVVIIAISVFILSCLFP